MPKTCQKFKRIKEAAKKGLRIHIHGLGNRFSGFVNEPIHQNLNEELLSAKLVCPGGPTYYFAGGDAANHLSVFVAP